jgi:hypothetical protein
MASINYPIGMNLGGDPSQALVHSNPSGKFTVALEVVPAVRALEVLARSSSRSLSSWTRPAVLVTSRRLRWTTASPAES